MATLQRRLDELEQQAEVQQQAAHDEWRAWFDRRIGPEDADRYWRWGVSSVAAMENPPQDALEARERFGEFVEWRDSAGVARVLFLSPLDIEWRVIAWADDDWRGYRADRRRYLAMLRYAVLAALGRELSGDVFARVDAWAKANGLDKIRDALRRVWLHGLRWEAVKPYLPGDVRQADFEAMMRGVTEPTDGDRRVVFDAPRVPGELADALADEWGL